jgi:septal ring factor EnvC (AmiA/AmiB activator)
VNEDPLKSELDQVTSELTTAETEAASLGAKIAGLQARQAALRKTLADRERRSAEPSSIAAMFRTDAIVAVLNEVGAEISIKDVVAALGDAGRHETYDNVGSDLAYLTEKGRVARIRRGVYAPISG